MNKIEYLLKDICIDLGFCLPASERERIINAGYWEADEFACQVIKAEGLNPEYEKKWRKYISTRFVKYLGGEVYENS